MIARVGAVLALGALLHPLQAADREAGPVPAVPALVAEFAHHPIVAIAEAHGLPQAGDLYVALVRDPAFQHAVNDIVVEFASRQSQPLLDRYVVAGDSLSPGELRSIWRNTTKTLSWDFPVYARWLAAIREANRALPAGHRMRVLAGDTPVDWRRLHAPADWAALGPNDVSFARVIVEQVLRKGHRALVVLGSNHLMHGGSPRDGRPNTTSRVEARYPHAMYVALEFTGWPGGDASAARMRSWARPSLFSLPGTWLGALPVGAAATRLDALADAVVYLGPPASLTRRQAPPAYFDAPYRAELTRRAWIEWGDSSRLNRLLPFGRVTEHDFQSRILGGKRHLRIYTPPGYTSGQAPCDLLVGFDGAVYTGDIPLPAILDSLIAARAIPPTVAVLIDNGSGAARRGDLANHAAFATFVGNELVPWIRRHYRVSTVPGRAVITGSSAGGLAAAYIALERPDLFGNVLSQSGAFWRGNEGSNGPPWEYIARRAANLPHRGIRFLLDVGALETHGAMGGRAPSILMANRRLRDTLEARGYRVTYYEVPGGQHSPASWRLRLPVDLVTLLGQVP